MRHRLPTRHLVILVLLAAFALPVWQAAGETATPPATGDLCEPGAATPAATPLDSGGATPAPAAGTPAATGTPGAITDQASFVAALEACGITVEPGGTISQPFFSPTSAVILRLSGGPLVGPADIQVYEYASADPAESDAAQIEPDGNLRTTIIEWVAPPHFYRAERLIVLYVGEDETTLALLSELLGPQFAGR